MDGRSELLSQRHSRRTGSSSGDEQPRLTPPYGVDAQPPASATTGPIPGTAPDFKAANLLAGRKMPSAIPPSVLQQTGLHMWSRQPAVPIPGQHQR